jgi:diadenylate cyclase
MDLKHIIGQMSLRSVIDIAAVALIVYGVLKLIKGTRAMQIVYGLMALTAIFFVARWYQLQGLEFLLRNAFLYLGIAIIVIFHPEIRAGLTKFGKYIPRPFGVRGSRRSDEETREEEVILAATTLSADRTGALIIFERTVRLDNFVDTGVQLDARVSYDLLVTIFNPRTPLHDGAVIIRGDRIAAASCFLPLTLNPQLSKELGTRHRAAIGITEDSDAVAVVVSEETGIISFASAGQITRHLDAAGLREALEQALEPTRRSLMDRARAARQAATEPAAHEPAPVPRRLKTLGRGLAVRQVSSAGESRDG